MVKKSSENLLARALDIEEAAAVDANALSFMARSLVICTLPHSEPKEQEFIRKNGDYTLSMIAPKEIGLPYGSLPRLLLAWISTEAVRTKSRTLKLGETLSHFLKELELSRSGSRDDIRRLRAQMGKLFACNITCNYHSKDRDTGMEFMIAQEYDLWWHPQHPDQAGLWESTLTLSQEFYDEIVAAPIPIEIRALKALKQSPMALDIYLWLAFRNSYLKSSSVIKWEQLRMQFGAEYAKGRAFKAAFTDALAMVQTVCPATKIDINAQGILVSAGPVHVAKSMAPQRRPGGGHSSVIPV
jgi:hypothetical protein